MSLLLPVCRYPPVSGHQDDVTQLSGPQVALHLAEGGVGVGQSGEHTLLRTCTWLHRHAWGQRRAAVRRPVPTNTNTHTHRQKDTKRRRQALNACVDADSLFVRDKETDVWTDVCALCLQCATLFFVEIRSHVFSPSLFNRVTVRRQKQTKAL